MSKLARWCVCACLALAGLGVGSVHAADGGYADLPGVRLWYTDTGGSGLAVILLHANTGTGESWAKQIAPLSAAGYRVIAFDRRGWGKSQAQPATGPQPGSIADDLDALATSLHLDRFFVVGVAGGGFAALDYTAWHPERVRALVVAASTGMVSDDEIDSFFKRLLVPNVDKLPEMLQELSAGFRGGDPAGTAAWNAIEAHARQAGAPSQPLHTLNTYNKLATIAAPMLVVAADADMLAPPALMRLWVKHVRHAEWLVIPESGHSVAWEQPDAFNQAVLAFLGKQ